MSGVCLANRPTKSLQMMTAMICVAASQCVQTIDSTTGTLLGFPSSALSSDYYIMSVLPPLLEQDKDCCVNLVRP